MVAPDQARAAGLKYTNRFLVMVYILIPGSSTFPVGRRDENRTSACYTEATEPRPQSSDMGGLNDFDNSKTAELLGSA